jgi:signal transduction histidine kinase
MQSQHTFRHVGGGPRGMFLALRYVFIITASYLLLFQAPETSVSPTTALTIASAMASNVALSLMPAGVLFAWWVQGPVLVLDTGWVAWALHASGAASDEFFLLYFFVLLLAAVGESLPMVVLGAVLASVVNVWVGWHSAMWTSPTLLRVVFFFSVSLFYGHVLTCLKQERLRGDRSAEWARVLETKVLERTKQLHELYERARGAARAKTDFMSSMSHELRTPLHIVIGYSEMLRDRERPHDDVEELATRIHGASTGLLSLVDGVLEMGRLESGRVPVNPRRLSIDRFIEDLKHREWIAPLPGVTLRWEGRPSATEFETDPGKLQIVLSNLITNALKFTTEGEVALRVEEEPDAVVFEVVDTGPGIPPERLAHIREPFHESSASTRIRGVGLGLAIVHGYAALLNAAVDVASVVGCGTTFRVRVPHALRPAA